jgi:ribose transport system ATP-binding protein
MDTAMVEPVLRIRDLSKTFVGTKALNRVNLDIAPGEIHALVGQNGSGKSTLIKILAGYHLADDGAEAVLDGVHLNLAHPTRARHDRLRFVHQDLGLFAECNTIENLALRGEFLTGFGRRVRWREQARLTRSLIAEFDADIDITKPVGQITPVQRTIVATAAALAGWEEGRGILVLDEPTSVLPPTEVSRLMELVRSVRERGTSVLYVSHRLDEVVELADTVSVLRGGEVVASRPVAGLDAQDVAALMVGGAVDANYRARLDEALDNPVVVKARDLSGAHLAGVSFDLHAGEILGVAGLPGSGREELPYAIAGMVAGVDGQVSLATTGPVPVARARSLGIPIVPADRLSEALFTDFSVAENLSISVLDRLHRCGLVNGAAERSLARRWIESIAIKTPRANSAITTLSGGNQQKVVVSRCLARDPQALVLCEPTAGVDVGSRQTIYEFIADRARAGLAVLIASSDIGDLLALCTRVIVLSNSHIVRDLRGAEITEAGLLRAMEETEQV